MRITFLIGNGFDLRVGMKTRFTDMYEGYIEQPSVSDSIRKFKDMLRKDAPTYKTWNDFEMAMAKKAKEFLDEGDFVSCLRDFKLYMAAYLKNEQEKFEQRKRVSIDARILCIKETTSSIEEFYKGLRPNVVNELLRISQRGPIVYSFVSFNYTKILDNMLEYTMGDVIHIHGTLGEDIVLGVDNMGQVVDLPYKTSKRFERAFIKPEFNKNYDYSRLEKVKNIIDSSDLICVYGMSLGNSDLSWVKRLKEWLLSDRNNHLVYFSYDERTFDKSNWDAIMDEEEDCIVSLLGTICDSSEEMDQIFEQVHIPVGYDIFSIDEILKAEKIKTNNESRKKEALQKQSEKRPMEINAV